MSIRMTRALVLLWLAVFTTAAPAPARAGADPDRAEEVGLVADYQPRTRPALLSRAAGSAPVRARLGSLLRAGDRIRLDAAGQSVILQMSGGEVLRFDGPGEFVVPDSRPLGRLAAIFASLPRLFDDTQGLSGVAASRTLARCSSAAAAPGPSAVPALVPGARFATGQARLTMAWQGGCPPSSVELRAASTGSVPRKAVGETRVTFDAAGLAAGAYTLRITDALGRTLETTLLAVDGAPSVPAELAADTSSLGIAARAVWIAGLDQGRWKLLSIEMLRPLAEAGDPFATAIREGLLAGGAQRVK